MKKETLENIVITTVFLYMIAMSVFLVKVRNETVKEIEVLSKEIDSLNSVEYLKRKE